MIRWRIGLAVAGLCAALVLAGCGSGDSPGPDGSSVSSSPVSSGPVSSTSLSEDELYAEAERVYRAYFELEQQAFLEGGVNGVPDEMNEYIMGSYAESEAKILAQMVDRQVKMQPGTRSEYIILQSASYNQLPDSLTSMTVCIDSTMSPLVNASGNFVASGFNINIMFFKYDADAKLKIYSSTAEQAESCSES